MRLDVCKPSGEHYNFRKGADEQVRNLYNAAEIGHRCANPAPPAYTPHARPTTSPPTNPNPFTRDRPTCIFAAGQVGALRFILLKDTITPDEARLVAEWLNADQDENMAKTEAFLLPTVQLTLRPTAAQVTVCAKS